MYHLTPPTESYKTGSGLWGRVPRTRSLAVVIYNDGRVLTPRLAPDATADGVTTAWPGGRTYEITDAQADVLIAAGYSAYLEVVA